MGSFAPDINTRLQTGCHIFNSTYADTVTDFLKAKQVPSPHPPPPPLFFFFFSRTQAALQQNSAKWLTLTTPTSDAPDLLQCKRPKVPIRKYNRNKTTKIMSLEGHCSHTTQYVHIPGNGREEEVERKKTGRKEGTVGGCKSS